MPKGNMPTAVMKDDPPSATEDVAKLRLHFRHKTLVELEDEGLVQWDREKHIVRKGPDFYQQ